MSDGPYNLTVDRIQNEDVSASAVAEAGGILSLSSKSGEDISLSPGSGVTNFGGHVKIEEDITFTIGTGNLYDGFPHISLSVRDRQLIGFDGSTLLLDWSDHGNDTVSIPVAKVILGTIPTSDPHNVGQLWNSAGTVKISAG